MELIVAVCASREQEAIVQSRCLGLTGTDIYIYIQTQNDNAAKLLASLYSSAIMYNALPFKYKIVSLLMVCYHVMVMG